MKDYKVSIIIPVYNGSDYMKEAIDSALNQTYKNIEILVVNDGSNDNGKTKKIAKSYGDKIKYFEKTNGGVSTALNLAIKNMTGDYFSWLSHDDRYYPNKIETQIEYLNNLSEEEREKTILYSDYDLMNEYSEIFAKSYKEHEELNKKKEYALLRGAINGTTLLIPKKAFDKCGLFDESLRCTQDYVMWRKMMDYYDFVHQEGILATTRLHQNQTGNTSPKMLSEGNEFWTYLADSFDDAKKIELNGSVYNYYKELLEFMKTTPYTETIDYLEKIVSKYEKDVDKKIKNTKVSVIIPFYNRVDEAIESINSVLVQTYKNIEIILVNDGSTDDIKALKDFIKGKKNIVYIDLKKNYGVAHARNVGISKASGEYIALLDSDDLLFINKIEEQLKYMLINSFDFTYTSYVRKRKDGEEIINCELDPKYLVSNCKIATPTVMIKSSIIKDNNIKYIEEYKYGEDVCFYIDISKYTKLSYFNKPLTVVNVNDNSSYNNRIKQEEGIKNIVKYCLNNNYDNNLDLAYLFYGFSVLFDPIKSMIKFEIDEEISKKVEELNKLQLEKEEIERKKYEEERQKHQEELNRIIEEMNQKRTPLIKKAFKALKNKGLIYCIKRAYKRIFKRDK